MTVQPIQLTPIGDAATTATAGCGCGGGSCAVDAPAPAGASTAQDTLLVEGMTCEHCVRAVTDELTAVEGVDGVDVELVVGGSSRVTVRASAQLDRSALQAAIEEAGYSLV